MFGKEKKPKKEKKPQEIDENGNFVYKKESKPSKKKVEEKGEIPADKSKSWKLDKKYIEKKKKKLAKLTKMQD